MLDEPLNSPSTEAALPDYDAQLEQLLSLIESDNPSDDATLLEILADAEKVEAEQFEEAAWLTTHSASVVQEFEFAVCAQLLRSERESLLRQFRVVAGMIATPEQITRAACIALGIELID